MNTVTPSFVREVIDFAPTELARGFGFAEQQLEGTTALFNMLQRNRCAYLADEVGMGKTYVALGVMALTRYFDPHARIVVIAPRGNIQRKWIKELKNFVRLNWQLTGNRVKSLQGEPAWEPVYCNSLVDFVREALLNADRDFFLRMTSFSLAVKDPDSRRRLRRQLQERVSWLPRGALSAKTPEAFRDAYGCAINAAIPPIDLLVVDEGHNLKHGFGPRVSNRNRVMGFSLGHPDGKSEDYPWYRHKAKRVLLLSATPFENDYAAIQRQLEIFRYGKARLLDSNGENPVRVDRLLSPDTSEDEKRDIVGRLMVRRVSGLKIGGTLHTKNMYRREWRQGGYTRHDEPMRLDDPKQRLVVGLMQQKVAEILHNERFKNSFQIGMLSSFESFLETIEKRGRATRTDRALVSPEEDALPSSFDGNQGEDVDERRGIDTDAVAHMVESYRSRFHETLPHPKLDSTAESFASVFETGEKVLVFVRRVRTVDELAAKLDAHFDRWLGARMRTALPELGQEIDQLFRQYEHERARRPDERLEVNPVDEQENEPDELPEVRAAIDAEDEGSAETFFSWFFRGDGPRGILSGAAFQKNRLSSPSSAYATFFEDDYVSWLLDRPAEPLSELARIAEVSHAELVDSLRACAYRHFTHLTQRAKGYPRLQVFLGYQQAALELVEKAGGSLGDQARVVLDERFPDPRGGTLEAPAGFPGPEQAIGFTSFISELVKHPVLRDQIWPEDSTDDFRQRFRKREQRRELLSAMARLGAAHVDLYLLAITQLGSFALRQEIESDEPVRDLARSFVELLDEQSRQPGFHAFYELSQAAEFFELLIGVNFPDVPNSNLDQLTARFGSKLQRQVPVGRMSGGVNKRLVSQFRMPGFPLALATTDVLQEGEDLHTFCRRVVHYGITWTPSAMEQRTGRIDRIGSLVQRRLDGTTAEPDAADFLQVYYPHLQDTVEVLQVRRVLHRLNRFLQLIHQQKGDSQVLGSRIDAAREMLEELDVIPPPQGELKSAFPIRRAWLEGGLQPAAVVRRDLTADIEHLEKLWTTFQERYVVRALRAADPLLRRGFALVRQGRLIHQDADERGMEQPFRLQLRSQAAGDGTLLHCSSEVGPLELEHDDDALDDLYKLQRDLGLAKVCVRPDPADRTDRVFVEGDIVFHPESTQLEELDSLVTRTVAAAGSLASRLIEHDDL